MAGRNPLVRAIYDHVMNMKRTGTGVGETLATLGSSAVAEPVSGLAGLSVLASTGDPNLAAQAVRSTQEGLTYQPRTLEGQSNLAGTSQLLQPVGEAMESASGGLGSYVQEKTGSPALAAAAHSAPTALAELIGAKGLGRVAKTGPQLELNDIGSQAHRQKGVFAGVKAKTANTEALNKAEQMKAAGGWWHGTSGEPVELFELGRRNPELSWKDGVNNFGHNFASNIDDARRYAGDGGSVAEYDISPAKTLDFGEKKTMTKGEFYKLLRERGIKTPDDKWALDSEFEPWELLEAKNMREALLEAGYDSVKFKEGQGETLTVLDSKLIKRKMTDIEKASI